jgi:hypothetical protein
MKQSKNLVRIGLIFSLGLLVLTCQKEPFTNVSQLNIDSESATAVSSAKLVKSGISADLSVLADKIKAMIKNGTIPAKVGKTLISNLDDALKAFKKGEKRDANRSLNAFNRKIEQLINNGTLSQEEGQALANVASYASMSIIGSPAVSEGLIAFYPFNGNSNDRSGNLRKGIQSNITFSADRNEELNSAAVFNGNGSIIFPGIGQVNGSFSISLWYRSGQDGSILATDNIFLGIDNTYDQFITSWNISIGTYSPSGNPVFFDNTWHNVVITHDSNAGVIITYFDGVAWHIRPESGTFLGNNEDIYIGMVIKEYIVQFPYIRPNFTGSIDDIYLFNRAITAAEVEQLYYYPH